ncbi:MAG: EAL domain-containing protein [Lachnospiraceae bacterium]|nr:EAL domain-containing protein [Lachnospiraceae bacterium]
MEKYRFEETERTLLEGSCIPFAVYQFIDKRVVTILLSDGFLELFGYEDRDYAVDAMDNDMYKFDHPDDIAQISDAAIRFATEGGEYNVVYRHRKDGKYQICHAFGKHVYTKTGVRLAYIWYTIEGTCRNEDVAQTEEELSDYFSRGLQEGSLIRRFNYDYLTGLPGMTYFFELAEQGRIRMREQGRKPVLLFIDLNDMKGFNLKYGFAEGDKLIRAVAQLLADTFTNENCCRFGQDHFVVYTELEGLEETLKRMFADCKRMNEGRTLPLRVGIYPDSFERVSASVACDRAKMACDVNREAYESHFQYFNEGMQRRAENRQYIIDNIDRALEEKWIKVYHQPIVRTANFRVSDEEALARWIDPVKGFMCPDDFIPALEDTKLIYKLDLYMTEQVLEKMKIQQAAGLYVVPESVNLSRYDFESCDIVSEIDKRVKEAGIDPGLITIEITESVIGSDFSYIKTQIERFQKLGYSVWMDDFGSGYSSLDILQIVHFDTIKLDMRFMKQFDKGEESRVILTELIKMIIGLGTDTVVEGVETKEQVEFLKEVGCTKIQGYYFCKPIPLEDILKRYEEGTAIGFENPDESEYFAAIGRVNLYDLATATNDTEGTLQDYFDMTPMAVLEYDGTNLKLVRGNRTYREFMKKNFRDTCNKNSVPLSEQFSGFGSAFADAVRQCAADGNRQIVDDMTVSGVTIHLFIRRIAVNPVTRVASLVLVLLGAADSDPQDPGLSYSYVVQALSSNYFYLYYVDMDTEKFVEYSTDPETGELSVERRGEDFFAACYRDAEAVLYEEDVVRFRSVFTKKRIVNDIREHGSFILNYRMNGKSGPFYANMKATRIRGRGNRIIIGVSNIDAQMKQQEALERAEEERITYARISALSGDYICIYTVDPETDGYFLYTVKKEYEAFGLSREGEHFFRQIRKESEGVIYEEDRAPVIEAFTKENVLKQIEESGIFRITYRLMIGGKPTYVNLKAALVQEKDGPKLIVGITNIDRQVRREQDYEHSLSVARNRANLDGLTGVKNKHAYVDMENRMNHFIAEHSNQDFAIVVFDINGLKDVNDTKGHQAGDELLRKGCHEVCTIFAHSPVYRIGGDEFVAVVQGHDYDHLDELMQMLAERNEENLKTGEVIVAGGCARFENDHRVSEVFRRADERMYENKKQLKERKKGVEA